VFGWQSIFIAGAVLPLALLPALWRWMPESPKYLAGRPARWPELAQLLNRVVGADRYQATQRFHSAEPGVRRRIGELFAPALRAMTLTLWIAFLCNVFAVYVFFNWLPTVLGSVGLPVAAAIRGSLYFNIGGVLGALVGALLMNYFGSLRVTVGLGLVSIVSTVMIGQHPVFNGAEAASAGVTLMALMSLAGVGINGLQTQLYVLAAHSFPTPLRATGIGSCGAIGRLGGVLSTGAGSVMFALGLSGGNFFLGLALVMVPTLLAMLAFRHHVQKLVD
jgi:AAHS family 4-hydroxybenzoate transporter-like MFS transporter